jgi:hypothetical protein
MTTPPPSSLATVIGAGEIGRWVAERRGQGWGSAEVDVDVVSRSSGTLSGFATGCVSR